jgi:formylglycine-generating enzyme required for sulfatase activity
MEFDGSIQCHRQCEVQGYGCQDMTGNVWELVKDKLDLNYYSQTPTGGWIDPQGPASGDNRVLRGGGSHDSGDVTGNRGRCAYRNGDLPGT